MIIDCDTCTAPVSACTDCVMTALLRLEPRPVEFDGAEFGAIGTLVRAGLVPPLRLVVGVSSGHDGASEDLAVGDEILGEARKVHGFPCSGWPERHDIA